MVWAPAKALLLWGKGGTVEQVTDFFAKKIGTSETYTDAVRLFLQNLAVNTVKSIVFKCAKRKVSQKVGSETANHHEGVCNRAGEPSVTFCE